MRLRKSGGAILALVIVIAVGCGDPSGPEDRDPVRINLVPNVSTLAVNAEASIRVQISGPGGINLDGEVDVLWAVTDSTIVAILSADRSRAQIQGLATGGATLTASVSSGDSTLTASTVVVVVP